MGSSFSQLEPSQNKTCLICWETIHFMELVQCYQCNIQLHTYCEETYRGGKDFVNVLIVNKLGLWDHHNY